jgi:hypothetical protein
MRLSLEDIRGFWGNIKIICVVPWRISFKAPIPSDYSVQNQFMYSNLLPSLDGQMQMAVSLLGLQLLWFDS